VRVHFRVSLQAASYDSGNAHRTANLFVAFIRTHRRIDGFSNSK